MHPLAGRAWHGRVVKERPLPECLPRNHTMIGENVIADADDNEQRAALMPKGLSPFYAGYGNQASRKLSARKNLKPFASHSALSAISWTPK